jgi:hypothetical protein
MKLFMLILASLAHAAFTTFGGDTNAAGIWKWSLAGQNGDTILKLKQDGEKLTGSYTNQFGKAEITDGSLKDGDIAFKVKRELNGQAFLIKYSGKLSGDKITGKCEFDVNGQTRALEWEAKRDTAKAAAAGRPGAVATQRHRKRHTRRVIEIGINAVARDAIPPAVVNREVGGARAAERIARAHLHRHLPQL